MNKVQKNLLIIFTFVKLIELKLTIFVQYDLEMNYLAEGEVK